MAADLGQFPMAIAVELEFGGEEVAGPFGGLEYRNTQRSTAEPPVRVAAGVAATGAGPWRVRATLTARPERPCWELRLAVTPRHGDELLLRDLRVVLTLEDAAGWFIEAPGNMIRPGVDATTVAGEVFVRGPGDELGSPGFVALHRRQPALTALVWPFSRAEQVSTTLRTAGDGAGLQLQIDTRLAGAVAAGAWLEHGPIYLDVDEQPWSDVVDEISSWYPAIGVRTPADRPAWAAALSIFEVMVGTAPFYGGHSYAPYPTIDDLIADLDRIAGLGFECLQLMPRHPYPSYNIHEPGDVATTYGDPEEIRRLVAECHRRDLRIIVDVLLHGVVDRHVIRRAVAGVAAGPHADQLAAPCDDVYDQASVDISWCRHIVAFADSWIEGSPERHHLLDDEPEWFMRDSAGTVTGIYTNALDVANRHWQDHFIAGCVDIVRDYEIDGFRVDAPLYNRFANWSPSARRHASHSSLASLDLLHRLREQLHAVRDDVLLHSEPGGALARESLDLCYSYEERWLVTALFDHRQSDAYEWRRVRNGAELARWFRDFDAALPAGSVSAHFIDVHDTMWWLLPGNWWRRDQIGIDATKAALVIHALRGGAYMTFVGGEVGLEAELTRLHELRRTRPELGLGVADYDAVTCDDDAVYCVIRRYGDAATLVAVNTSDQEVRCRCTVDRAVRLIDDNDDRLTDVWNADEIGHHTVDDTITMDLSFGPYQSRIVAR